MSLFSAPTPYPRYTTIEKAVGETPLVALERVRQTLGLPPHIPLAYAGRLDPMASGKLLILIGDECKVQEKYHAFDKEYEVEVLLGVRSDTGDVLGLIDHCEQHAVTLPDAIEVLKNTVGRITLPYPHFSSKTVKGKPLHTWTLEGRLGEIEIPVKESRVYKLTCTGLQMLSKKDVVSYVRTKIETIPEVVDPKKELGANFRRDHVRASWNMIEETGHDSYQLLRFTCIASSGTYMRSLGEHIATTLGTCGLAFSIHRTRIGTYVPITRSIGFFTRWF